MSDHQPPTSNPPAREQELEIEVARLQAEVDALRGEDPSVATSRFLAMAAATVDRAVEDARREADEIVQEISAEAEARRDEATRVAAEAEAMADRLLADADRAQERVERANEEAEAIRAEAETEAAELVRNERERAAGEMEALTEARAAIDRERAALESYHEQLQQKVQELAQSMVSFMANDLPTGAAIEDLAAVSLEAPIRTDPPVPDPWAGALEAAIPAGETHTADETHTVDETHTAGEATETHADTETADAPFGQFAEREILEPAAQEVESSGAEGSEAEPSSTGLFSRAAADGGEPKTGIFGMFGSRLVQQTDPDDLAESLEETDRDDAAFQEFLTGDDGPDPSRDWLLRNEPS